MTCEYVSAVTEIDRCPTSCPIVTQATPRRCSSEMRRWRRSCGLNSGMPAARHAFAIDVRSAAAPEPANRTRVGVAVLARAERLLEVVGEHGVELDPERPPRLRRRGAEPDAATRLVVVRDERRVDAADAGSRPVEEQEREPVLAARSSALQNPSTVRFPHGR